MRLKTFPYYQQLDAMDCGPSCLRMIAKYYGHEYSLQTLREYCNIGRSGVSLLGISEAAERIGVRSLAARISLPTLKQESPLPCVLHWDQNHFVVLYKIKRERYYIANPAAGLQQYTEREFLEHWCGNTTNEGIVLFLEPGREWYEKENMESVSPKSIRFLLPYFYPYKKLSIQLVLGLFLGTGLQLIFPFLTQSLVDYGVNYQDIGFVYTILLAQLMLFLSRTSLEFLRTRILLHIGSRINISLISDFLIKLMKLPISFFDTKLMGDLLQRIDDHTRIQTLLTSGSLQVLFSFINLVVFGIVLCIYSLHIALLFLLGSLVVTFWLLLFLRKRKELDQHRFGQLSKNRSLLIQLFNGIPEIKLSSSEQQKRWEWEQIQARLFTINLRTLSVAQYQQAGFVALNELKNIFITFLAAKYVIDGQMTLGMMLAISYMIGQMNSPLDQLVAFIHTLQDARTSLERLNEIQLLENEDNNRDMEIPYLPTHESLYFKNVSFRYPGPHSPLILNNLTFDIPQNKITAIVGTSGSGKTTLLKLLLKFYDPSSGEIRLGDTRLSNINTKKWRQQCGVVLQEGFLFHETIARNIALGSEEINATNLVASARTANIHDYIESLPLGYGTKIGLDGQLLSQGQKQRILIARAVYKNPEYLFFDEATSALDSTNEHTIMDRLEHYCKGKTVVVIAHRLSTVRNADQIIVLENGTIVEHGTHHELTNLQNIYYNLVRNQLELGN